MNVYEWYKNILVKHKVSDISLKNQLIAHETGKDKKERWFKQNVTLIVSLIAYFYVMWDFLIGRTFFSSDFYHLHIMFELAYKSLDKNFTLSTWLPLFQGGKATFGDMANSYSPFGIDFILTYAFSKLMGLDRSIGLVLIDTWRMVLLNVFFAFGCRQFAREFLKLRYSVDFVFLITLFVGASFLPHRPIFVIANIFSPWILLYMSRIIIKFPDRWLHNLAGLALASIGSVFHQFNIQTTVIWPYIIFYFIGLLLFFPGRFIHLLTSWKGRLGIVFVVVVILISLLPLAVEYDYFNKYNRKMLYPGETVESSIKDTVYNLDDFVQERFEFQKLLSFFFPYPATLERVTNMTNGMPGMVLHNFQYFGVLAAILMIIGLIFSRNYYRYPVLAGIILYILFSTIERFPVFLTAWRMHVPMTRHFTFVQLHLAPLLAVLAGIGMDRVLTALPRMKVYSLLGRVTAGFVLGSILYISYLMVKDNTFSSAYQGYLYSVFFIVLTIIGILGTFHFSKPHLRFRILLFIALIDLVTFNHINKTYLLNTGRGDEGLIYVQSINYDRVLPDLPILNNFFIFSPLPSEAYVMWVKPSFYFPEVYRYAIIGNKSFYDVLRNTTHGVRDMISGFTLPRLFVADTAVEDPNGEITRKILSRDQAEQIVGNTIFLNGPVITGRDAIRDTIVDVDIYDPSKLLRSPKILVTNEMSFYDVLPEMISSNIPVKEGSVSAMFDRDMSTMLKPDVSHIQNDKWWWIQIDFGPRHEKNLNFVKIFMANNSEQCPWDLSFIEGSHHEKDWKRLGYLTSHPYDNHKTSKTTNEWQFINDESFRYYKIFIEKKNKIPALHLISQIKLGGKSRKLMSSTLCRYKEKVPLIRFKNHGLSADRQYYLFSYFIPRSSGVDISTNPTQQFAFVYKIKWSLEDGEIQLHPTWDNNWHSENLFQIGYVVDSQLIINVPVGKIMSFRKSILDITIEALDNGGVKVLDYGADNLLLTVERSKPGWLYYSDTWDKYWVATANGEKAPVYKANLQFKAVYVPAGKSTVHFLHKPKIFFKFILLSYILQLIVLLIWIKTMRSKSLSEESAG